MDNDSLSCRAIKELRRGLKSQTSLVQLHAAEALLHLGYRDGVEEVFRNELAQCENQPQIRIAIWRVLAQAATDKKDRAGYVNKIRDAYLDPTSQDREIAAESLAKLQYAIPQQDQAAFLALAQDRDAEGISCRRWLVAASGNDDDVRWLAELLDSPDIATRGIAAYALRYLAVKLPHDVIAKLLAAANAEPESKYRVYLISAAYATAADSAQVLTLKQKLLSYVKSANTEDRYEVAAALALRGSKSDLPQLTELLNDQDPNVRISAANAILQINHR